MLKLKRIYDQNRKEIWLTALIIAFCIIILQLINWIVKVQNNKPVENNNYQVATSNIVKKENNVIVEEESALSGGKVNSSKLKTDTDVVKQFINYCKEQKVEEAYNMLTEECKEVFYPSIDTFINNYYSKTFANSEVICTVENWYENTYKVKIAEDILSKGTNNNSAVQDYITVKEEEEGYKLNINQYIGREEIEKVEQNEQYAITIISRDIYMNYEQYKIRIKNNTEDEILLDTMTDEETMYLQDSVGGKYPAYNHELAITDLDITAGNEKEISIKYYSSFNSGKNIKRLVFSDVILNYNSNHKILNDYEKSIIEIAI